MAAALVLAGCSDQAAEPQPLTTSTEPSTPTATATAAPDIPRQQAVAAWREYLDAVSAAQRAEDPELAVLEEVASGDALIRAQIRARPADPGWTITGKWLPSNDPDVSLSDDGTSAKITDCVQRPTTLEGGEELPVSRDRTSASATVEQRDGRWVATSVKLGSEPCVPAGLEQPILTGYREGWAAWRQATANPGDEQLRQQLQGHEVDPAKARSQEVLDDLEQASEKVVGDVSLQLEVVEVRDGDSVAIVRDCQLIRRPGTKGLRTIHRETGEVIVEASPGQRSLWLTRMERHAGDWMVAQKDLKKENAGESCGGV